MRAPPPVEFASGPDRGWRGLSSLLAGVSLAALAAWALPILDLPGRADVALALGGFACGAAWLAWSCRACTLGWDGQDWLLREPGSGHPEQRGDAVLVLDLGPWMLVRFVAHEPTGSTVWLPLGAAGQHARWAALRGALWNWRSHGAPRP